MIETGMNETSYRRLAYYIGEGAKMAPSVSKNTTRGELGEGAKTAPSISENTNRGRRIP